jgi:hypothetical protein
VASFILIVPAVIAAEKRGAGPNSPRLTAEVSSVSTQPADQKVGLQTRGGQRQQMQPLDAAPDQRARRFHRHARHLAGHDQQAAIGDGRQRFFD